MPKPTPLLSHPIPLAASQYLSCFSTPSLLLLHSIYLLPDINLVPSLRPSYFFRSSPHLLRPQCIPLALNHPQDVLTATPSLAFTRSLLLLQSIPFAFLPYPCSQPSLRYINHPPSFALSPSLLLHPLSLVSSSQPPRSLPQPIPCSLNLSFLLLHPHPTCFITNLLFL